jgi:hypothetical protein
MNTHKVKWKCTSGPFASEKTPVYPISMVDKTRLMAYHYGG